MMICVGHNYVRWKVLLLGFLEDAALEKMLS